MAILRLIDTSPKGTETHKITGIDRVSARTVLKGDLRATSDRVWGDKILARFDAGENSITVPNGTDHEFTVEYVEDNQ